MTALLEPSRTCRRATAQSAGHPRAHPSVADGKLTALIGPNGHGKTTLLRTISGLVPVREGDNPSLRHRALTSCAPTRSSRRHRPCAAGRSAVSRHDGASKTCGWAPICRQPAAGKPQELEEVFSLLPKLRDRQNQMAGTLSGGERRMVGIGRGLMADARLLMLDEPSLGLAPIIIDQIYEVIRPVARCRQDHSDGRGKRHPHLRDCRPVASVSTMAEFVWSGNGSELMASAEILNSYLGG